MNPNPKPSTSKYIYVNARDTQTIYIHLTRWESDSSHSDYIYRISEKMGKWLWVREWLEHSPMQSCNCYSRCYSIEKKKGQVEVSNGWESSSSILQRRATITTLGAILKKKRKNRSSALENARATPGVTPGASKTKLRYLSIFDTIFYMYSQSDFSHSHILSDVYI